MRITLIELGLQQWRKHNDISRLVSPPPVISSADLFAAAVIDAISAFIDHYVCFGHCFAQHQYSRLKVNTQLQQAPLFAAVSAQRCRSRQLLVRGVSRPLPSPSPPPLADFRSLTRVMPTAVGDVPCVRLVAPMPPTDTRCHWIDMHHRDHATFLKSVWLPLVEHPDNTDDRWEFNRRRWPAATSSSSLRSLTRASTAATAVAFGP